MKTVIEDVPTKDLAYLMVKLLRQGFTIEVNPAGSELWTIDCTLTDTPNYTVGST